ncbi:MAG: aldo/keto reductase, partial [Chloroflexota bacterium]
GRGHFLAISLMNVNTQPTFKEETMEYSHLPGIEKPISRLVQGSMMINSQEKEKSFALLDAVVEHGCTTFDTAHGYGGGDSERTLGDWVKDRSLREKLVIIAKGAHHSRDRKRVTPYDISADLFDSLARQKTDYFDLYLLHRDDPDVPVGPIVEALNEHQQAGRIRAFGGSNWTHERLLEANAYAEANNLSPFVASSPNYSLADQKEEPWPDCVTISGPKNEAIRDWYVETQTPLFTWSSLASGFFSDRYRRDNLDGLNSNWDKVCIRSYCAEDNFQRLDRARELGQEKGLSVPQVALAFVLSQPLNIHTLVGCQTADEFRANAEAVAVKLSQDELDWLDLKRDER